MHCYTSQLKYVFRLKENASRVAGQISPTPQRKQNSLRLTKNISSVHEQSPDSHCVPLNPGAQLQLNPFTRSVQVPLFLQGLLAQSSISVLEDKIETIKMRCFTSLLKYVFRLEENASRVVGQNSLTPQENNNNDENNNNNNNNNNSI